MPFGEDTSNSETQPEFDTEAAVADISSELFGQGTARGEDTSGKPADSQEPGKSSGTETAVDTPAPDASKDDKVPEGDQAKSGEPDNNAAVQDTGAPKTWTKEALEQWATIPPRAQQEILKREEDFMRGIAGYKESADLGARYNQVVTPYAPILAAENIDPVQLFQSFAGNHYLLSRGTDQQKIDVAVNLIRGYNLPLDRIIQTMGNVAVEPVDPQIAALQKELADLKGGLNQRSEAERNQALAATEKVVSDFAADPAHPYYNEVSDDIIRLLEGGIASSLQDAYDKAVYANPVTRQKELDRLMSERDAATAAQAQERADKIAKSTGADVKANAHERDGTIPVGSVDDTLEATLSAIRARG